MYCKFNSFVKKGDSKTAFVLKKGEAIFADTAYLLQPIYIHSRSPKFALVSRGKHISGFFEACGGFYIGDYKKQALLIHLREFGFDLFQTDLSPLAAKNLLCNGVLTPTLTMARESCGR